MALNELNKIDFEIEWRVAGVAPYSLLDKVVRRKLKGNYPKAGLMLLGNLDEKRLLERMMEADIFVLPSHIENSPNSLCEAMIIGMPCITTLAGGSSSLLRDKTEGLVIQEGDPWSMAGSILEMASNEEMAIEYGVRARERALQRHDRSKIVDDLLQIYNQIRS
jgi:glycosyltransferase involved in cell wall biosynthesis